MEDNNINAKLKVIAKLKKETANCSHVITIKNDGYSCSFIQTRVTLSNISFSNLLDNIIIYINTHRQYFPKKVKYEHGYEYSKVRNYKLKNKTINGKKEN